MATTDNAGKAKAIKKIDNIMSKEEIISVYMDYVLLNEKIPLSVYKFCKVNNLTEAEFYKHFGSFEGLQSEIWNSLFQQSILVINQDEVYATYTNREKMLAFYFTFFEMLTLNRSYMLFVLREHKDVMRNLLQLRGLRRNVKNFASQLIQEKNDEKQLKILKQSVTIFSEGAWLQTLFLLKYWMDDNSAGFENTDLAIEKSVRAIFDIFDTKPMESILDFGKFLWKEKMA